MSMTKLEQTLAEALAKATNVDIPAIIAAANACCVGGCGGEQTVQTGKVETLTTAAGVKGETGAKRVRRTAEPEAPADPAPATPPATEAAKPAIPPPPAEKPADPPPAASAPQGVGIDLTGLFTGSGADKKVVKDVFLKAVEKASNLAALVALNAACDCGFSTGDYTEETVPVLKRKLSRWGAAQE